MAKASAWKAEAQKWACRIETCTLRQHTGSLAQPEERRLDKAEVAGSFPARSTRLCASGAIGGAAVSKTEGWGFDTLVGRQGNVPERSIGPVSKTVRRATVTSVRIAPFPPYRCYMALKNKDFPYNSSGDVFIRKIIVSAMQMFEFSDIGDDARRQYIDAEAVFSQLEKAQKEGLEVRGGMYWKKQNTYEYLIRTSTTNAQTSLGPKSPETEKIYTSFMARKRRNEERVRSLTESLERHQRVNRALRVGSTPQILVQVLTQLKKAGIEQHFIVVGTHAMYAYQAAAGVRIASPGAMATQDVDLLWDTRKRLQLVQLMQGTGQSMLKVLKKVDPTFELDATDKYKAINDTGFQVDIIRREAKGVDPHPLQITPDDNDFWVVQARRAGSLLDSPKFSAVVVSASGQMERMTTISPVVFASFKHWMSSLSDREPLKKRRDELQATIVDQMILQYFPQLLDPT